MPIAWTKRGFRAVGIRAGGPAPRFRQISWPYLNQAEQILADLPTLSQPGWADYAHPITAPSPQIFRSSDIPRVDDVVWNNAGFWKRYGDLRGKEQKASFVSKTTETTAAAANSLLCQGIEPIIMPKLCHAMVPVASAANFLTWQEILTD